MNDDVATSSSVQCMYRSPSISVESTHGRLGSQEVVDACACISCLVLTALLGVCGALIGVYELVVEVCAYSAGGSVEGCLLGGGCSCLLYTSPSPRDGLLSRMPSSA